MEIAWILENRGNFERGFLYRASQKRRTPLPTHQNLKIPILYFHHKLSKYYKTQTNKAINNNIKSTKCLETNRNHLNHSNVTELHISNIYQHQINISSNKIYSDSK